MRQILSYCLCVFLFLSCGQSDNKQKELELKEKELALKEKELEIKQKELDANLDTSKQTKVISKQVEVHDTSKNDVVKKQTNAIPFVGIKNMDEFWLVGEGSGQNIFYSIDIKSNGDVYLIKTIVVSYSGEVQSKTQKFVGHYQSILKGVGEFSPNEYYKITKTKFSIVDAQGNLLKLSGCCNQHSIAETGKQLKCSCEAQYY